MSSTTPSTFAGLDPKSALTLLTRLARRRPVEARQLKRALSGRFRRLVSLAVDVAIETGDPIGRIAASLLEAEPDAALAERLFSLLPPETVALREFALEVTRQCLASARAAGEDGPRAAKLAGTLVTRLHAPGRVQEALGATEDPIGLLRSRHAAQPQAAAADLATALTNLSIHCSALSRGEEALAANEEALSLFRGLCKSPGSQFCTDVARTLMNLGVDYRALERTSEAIAVAEEATAIYRRLADEDPRRFLPGLAFALHNLSTHYGSAGRREEALDAAEEAVDLRRRLAEADPDAFLPDLAGALDNLGVRCTELHRLTPALAATEEGLAIRRRLAGDDRLQRPGSRHRHSRPAAAPQPCAHHPRRQLPPAREASLGPDQGRPAGAPARRDSMSRGLAQVGAQKPPAHRAASRAGRGRAGPSCALPGQALPGRQRRHPLRAGLAQGGQFSMSPGGALPQGFCYRIGWLPQQECYPGGGTAGVADGGAAQHGDATGVGGGDHEIGMAPPRVRRRAGSSTSWWRWRGTTACTRSGCCAGASLRSRLAGGPAGVWRRRARVADRAVGGLRPDLLEAAEAADPGLADRAGAARPDPRG
jgi:tetratricopeptide (TPR) repeat protein